MSSADVRPATQAGLFYPSGETELRRFVRQALDGAKSFGTDVPPRGLVCPHAGYVFSGQAAAQAYRQIEGMEIERVIVIGPSHHSRFDGASIYDGKAYATPLGKVELDSELIAALRDSDSLFICDQDAHLKEHSIEVQLPFLQLALKDFKLVPVLISDQSEENVFEVSEALLGCLESQPVASTMFVASSDLYHGHDYEELQVADHRFEEALGKFEPRLLLREAVAGNCMACGAGPVAAVMDLSRKTGATEARMLMRTNSRDANPLPGSSYIVGYAAAMFC